MAILKIDVVSDPTCPFCYLGKARLDHAIQIYKNLTPEYRNDIVSISWRPFVLDLEAPDVGVPAVEYMSKRHGPAKLDAIHSHVKEMGIKEGLNFTFMGKIGNTKSAQCVMQLAKAHGNEVENKVMGCIMKSYFEQGGSITSWQMLCDAAEQGGLDRAEVHKWLAEGTGVPMVEKDLNIARDYVHGVPHFVVENKYHADGAQSVESLLRILVSARRSVVDMER